MVRAVCWILIIVGWGGVIAVVASGAWAEIATIHPALGFLAHLESALSGARRELVGGAAILLVIAGHFLLRKQKRRAR